MELIILLVIAALYWAFKGSRPKLARESQILSSIDDYYLKIAQNAAAGIANQLVLREARVNLDKAKSDFSLGYIYGWTEAATDSRVSSAQMPVLVAVVAKSALGLKEREIRGISLKVETLIPTSNMGFINGKKIGKREFDSFIRSNQAPWSWGDYVTS